MHERKWNNTHPLTRSLTRSLTVELIVYIERDKYCRHSRTVLKSSVRKAVGFGDDKMKNEDDAEDAENDDRKKRRRRQKMIQFSNATSWKMF